LKKDSEAPNKRVSVKQEEKQEERRARQTL